VSGILLVGRRNTVPSNVAYENDRSEAKVDITIFPCTKCIE
jgi:hypothetical protein